MSLRTDTQLSDEPSADIASFAPTMGDSAETDDGAANRAHGRRGETQGLDDQSTETTESDETTEGPGAEDETTGTEDETTETTGSEDENNRFGGRGRGSLNRIRRRPRRATRQLPNLATRQAPEILRARTNREFRRRESEQNSTALELIEKLSGCQTTSRWYPRWDSNPRYRRERAAS